MTDRIAALDQYVEQHVQESMLMGTRQMALIFAGFSQDMRIALKSD